VAVNYREADIMPRQKAKIDFAMKVNTDSDFFKSLAHDACCVKITGAFFYHNKPSLDAYCMYLP
jgi:hypothetical protein